MKKILLSLLLLTTIKTFSQKNYQQIHADAILIDSHNDILNECFEKGYSFDQNLQGKTHSDLNRMLQGGIDIQVFSIWCDGKKEHPFAYANKQIDSLYAWIARNTDKMMLVTTPKQLQQAVKQHKLGAMIGVEGGHMIENNIAYVDSLYNRGTRYMTLTWNNSTSWSTSAMEETKDSLLHQPKGLSTYGKQIVQRMNALGMMVDLSHVGEQTFWDAIHTSTKPVLVSHSCVYNLCPVFRNLKDDQIKAVAKSDGVIQLNFYSGFIDSNYEKRMNAIILSHKAEADSLKLVGKSEAAVAKFIQNKYKTELEAIKAPLSKLLDHLDYIVKLVGVDYVGLGSDFDGIEAPPAELTDVTKYPLVTKGLLERGYSKKEIEKILGGNFIRVFEANSR